MAATVATNGLAILLEVRRLHGRLLHRPGDPAVVPAGVRPGTLFLGQARVQAARAEIKEAFLLSFATASSEAAYPKILDALDRFGVAIARSPRS